MGILDIFKSQNQKENNSNVSSENNFGVKEIEALIEKGTPCADAIKNASRFIEEKDIESILNNFAINKESVNGGVIFTFEDEGKLNLTSDGILTRVKNRRSENVSEISKLVDQVNQNFTEVKQESNLIEDIAPVVVEELENNPKKENLENENFKVNKEEKKRPAFKRR